jgi:hypothetical protein
MRKGGLAWIGGGFGNLPSNSSFILDKGSGITIANETHRMNKPDAMKAPAVKAPAGGNYE